MTRDEYMENVASYLLGALPDDERDAFETHLETCTECRAEVDHLRVASDALPNAAIQLSPPPELKDRIMAVVHQEAELLRAAGPDADRVEVPAPRRRRKVMAVLRPGWWSMRPGLALVASVMVLAVGAAGALVAESAIDGGGTTEVAFEVGSGKLLIPEEGHSTLVVADLEAPAPGHVYQVWLKHRGEAAPQPTNALFSGSSDGSASVDVPGSLDDVEQVLVTEEPDGGSSAPTTKPIIVAEPA